MIGTYKDCKYTVVTKVNYQDAITEILASEHTSYWLKEQIELLDTRDVLDVAWDTEMLATIAKFNLETRLDQCEERKAQCSGSISEQSKL